MEDEYATTIKISHETRKELNKIKYEKGFKTLDETMKFLLNKEKEKSF